MNPVINWYMKICSPKVKRSEAYCKPINIGGYLIWRFLPSGHIDCYLNWLSLVMFSMNLMKAICIGGYLIWQFFGPSQIHQIKSPPNINRFTVYCFPRYQRSNIRAELDLSVSTSLRICIMLLKYTYVYFNLTSLNCNMFVNNRYILR